MAARGEDSSRETTPLNPYSFWLPRFWHGMLLPAWARLLVRNRFAVHPTRLPMAGMISLFSVLNSSMSVLQSLLLDKRIEPLEIAPPPLFIVGHWRSGTTYLHELLVLDPRHSYPTTYQCFCPGHFLLSEEFVSRWGGMLLPERRPMDNVAAGWKQPQEDEFALANLGACTPYLKMAFPNQPDYEECLGLRDISSTELQSWKDSYLWFLKRVFYRTGQRIVLKSPPHTARLSMLAEMFPGAKFLHITRDPLEMYPSTIRLWKSLYTTQGLQKPRFDNLEEYVLGTFEQMYEDFERQRILIDASQIWDVRYEDLVTEPVEQLRAAYGHLELGEFDSVRPRFEQYVEEKRDYKRNRHQIDDAMRKEVLRRWGPYLSKYGYGHDLSATESASSSAPS